MSTTVKGIAYPQATTCPHCGGPHSHQGTLDQTDLDPPRPGDWTLCAWCGQFCAYTRELTLRRLTKSEERDVDADPDARRARKTWRQMNPPPH